MLPEIEKKVLNELNFPTLWQTVIFRNYNYVPTDNIAKVLNCSKDTVIIEAKRLGLFDGVDLNWIKKGYQTIIRNNWFLLPYNQLLTLLDFTEEKLDYILKEEDFFWVKLGKTKPLCDEVHYFPLSIEQIEQTQSIKIVVQKYLKTIQKLPFDFFSERAKFVDSTNDATGERIIHGFLTPCGDVFLEDSTSYLPDELLQAYKENGINGLWMHGVLSTLSFYPFKPSLCKDFQKRRKNLNNLIKRCLSYGIKTYIYFNEPRCLPEQDFNNFSNLKGDVRDGFASLCFEQKEVRDYLYTAVKDLLDECPELGGIITITMSENQTHCRFRGETNCPTCSKLSAERPAVDVNNVFMKAVRDSKSNCELIANLWAWAPYMGISEEEVLKGIEELDKDISVMCVSESLLPLEKNGVSNVVIDYSISNPGPSEYSLKMLSLARKLGHKVYAKIQVNNSWEMSAVPYIPVFDLVYEHLYNLSKVGIYDYMLSWTQGGYPSPSLNLISEFSKERENFDLGKWYRDVFEEDSIDVHNAVKMICDGFRDFPFSLSCLYKSPKNLGSANLWTLNFEDKFSCMVGYSYDDYERWCSDYPYEKYCEQFELLLEKWQKGLEILEKINNNKKISEILTFAKGAYLHFEYDLIHTRYAYYKRDLGKYKTEFLQTLEKGRINAEETIKLIYKDSRFGFEASNHYYYTVHNIIEKILNIDVIKKQLS